MVTVELKRKVDDATIEAIIKELDENSNEQPMTSIDHYQKKLHREKFLDLLKDYKIDDKDVDAMCFKLTGENMNNLPTTLLYKMGDRLISRENFLHMLKENGEKLTDEEIASILKVLVGDPDPTHLPPMLSFDYIFENILLMEKEDREINK